MGKYSSDWKDLSAAIKDRDGRKCAICGRQSDLATHHIDGDTNNNDPANLITLCGFHHMKRVHGHGRRGTLCRNKGLLQLLAARKAARNRQIRRGKRHRK